MLGAQTRFVTRVTYRLLLLLLCRNEARSYVDPVVIIIFFF